MKTVKVTFSDGDTLVSRINGTEEEIRSYYIGHWFNLGSVNDRMVQAVSVEFLA